MTTETNVSTLPDTTEWISRREIENIAGALKPSAYVARAYKYTHQNNGTFPDWARKPDNDKWLFLAEYIRADARRNTETMSVHEAAEVLGATRRAVQLWVDQGEIPALQENREQGGERRIVREMFMKELPRLKKRLETPSVVIRKIKSGHDVPADVIERVQAEMRARQAARDYDKIRKQEPGNTGKTLRPSMSEEKESATAVAPSALMEIASHTDKRKVALALEQRLKAAAEARKRAEAKPSLVPPPDIALTESENVGRQALKEKSAATLEARLKGAVAEKMRVSLADRTKLEEQALLLAETIQTRMCDEGFATRKAMIIFMQEAANQGIPEDIRIKVSERFFCQ